MPTRQSVSPARVPNLSSTKLVTVTGSAEALATVKVNATVPPDSGTEVGSAVFVTVIVGATSVYATVAVSDAVASVPSSSVAVAVNVSTCEAPTV